MLKKGDKVRFINKTKGWSLEEFNFQKNVDVIKDCYGVYSSRWVGSPDNVWQFNESDLVPFTEINYDQLTEIEE